MAQSTHLSAPLDTGARGYQSSNASAISEDVAVEPHLTGNTIEDQGLTLLATGGTNPAFDIFFVHGLQGHPEHTWSSNSDLDSRQV